MAPAEQPLLPQNFRIRSADRVVTTFEEIRIVVQPLSSENEKMARAVLLLTVFAAACNSGLDDEADAYDQYRQPERLVAALGLQRGQRVADVGAGRGYLTFRLADAVGPEGVVVATDIDDSALEVIRARNPPLPNVVVRKVEPDDPGLESALYDLILLSEVDQYLTDRADYLTKLRAALRPGGRLAVTNLNVFRTDLLAAATQVGYSVAVEVSDLPEHFLVLLVVNAMPRAR